MDYANAPYDVLIEIFSRLAAKDVIVCSKVCKNWNNIIDSHEFWIVRCRFQNYLNGPDLSKQLHKIPIQTLKVLLVKQAFNRNLLDDDYMTEEPTIDKRWSDFGIKRTRTSDFKIQAPPDFLSNDRSTEADECPQLFESCLVSSYQAARRYIYVDLAQYGLTAEVLNDLKPTIVATEYYTNRKDCACVYNFSSLLIDSKNVRNNRAPDHLPNWNVTDVRIHQWDNEYWRKAEHVWKEYPDDKAVMCLSTHGCDGQFWAGNYGVKISGTSLEVKLEFNHHDV